MEYDVVIIVVKLFWIVKIDSSFGVKDRGFGDFCVKVSVLFFRSNSSGCCGG